MIGRWMRWLGGAMGIAGALSLLVVAGVDWLARQRDGAPSLYVPGPLYVDLIMLVVIGCVLVVLGMRFGMGRGPGGRMK